MSYAADMDGWEASMEGVGTLVKALQRGHSGIGSLCTASQE